MSKLTRLAGGSGVNLWYYTSNDALSVVSAANYFSTPDATGGEMNGQSALGMMNEGDVIFLLTLIQRIKLYLQLLLNLYLLQLLTVVMVLI